MNTAEQLLLESGSGNPEGTDNRIPVTLLTGFLGSGKTTLLNTLLRHKEMKNTAVIINEIGAAGLDHILARHVEDTYINDNTVLLDSGCLCCSLRTELADTLRDLFFQRALGAIPPFHRLVIETTGLADPGQILAHLLNEPVIVSAYRLDAVIVTVDSVYGLNQLQQHAEARKQAAVADVLLLSKTDLATQAQISALSAALQQLNPGASQHHICFGQIDPQAIINVGLFDLENHTPKPQRWLRAPERSKATRGMLPQAVHDDDIGSFTVTLPTSLRWQSLEAVLLKLCEQHGKQLLRLKGIIHAEDESDPLAVHAVHHTLYTPTPLIGWQEETPMSRMVLIGKGLDELQIRNMLMRI